VSEFRLEFHNLAARAVTFATGRAPRVIILSIPDWGVTPFARGRDRATIAREIDDFNRIAREEAELIGARFVDITAVARRASDNSSLVAADGLHPSGVMYDEWARLVEPVALDALARI
jgi:lysophospholipase L1-like esterase